VDKKYKKAFDKMKDCGMVHNDMNTLPKQGEIEEFLGTEFFPKYNFPLPLVEAVDMVQLEFNVNEDDRKIPLPNGHGSSFNGGTILECLTHFAMLRLQEKGFLIRVAHNTYRWKEGSKWFSKVSRKDFNHLMTRLTFGVKHGETVETMAADFRDGNWDENTIQAVVREYNLTNSKPVVA